MDNNRDELLKRLHEKIQFAQSRRIKGNPASVLDQEPDNDNDDDDTTRPKSEAVRRRNRKKRERKRQRKLAKAYESGGMNGIMNAMGVKDPNIRQAVHRLTGSGSSQLQPGSGQPTQQTIDNLIHQFQAMSNPNEKKLEEPEQSSSDENIVTENRLLIEDISDNLDFDDN